MNTRNFRSGQRPSKRPLGWMSLVPLVIASVAGCGQQTNAPSAVQPAAAQTPVPSVVATPSPTTVAPQYAPPQAQAAATSGQAVPPAPPSYANAPAPLVARGDAPAATYAHRQPVREVTTSRVPSDRVGRIASIEPIRERPQGSGAGGVLGGVLGAVVGNQFGHGNGRTAMTIVGAAGGAVAGNNVERNVKERVVGYRISVTLDDGASRSYEESQLGGFHVGDRVRVDGNGLRRI